MIRGHLSICYKNQRGFTLFEIVVVVLLIGLLMTFAIDRMLRLQIAAERVSVQQTIGVLKSAVNLQTAERVVAGGLESLRSLENSNPVDDLSELPHNYLGEKSDSLANDLPAASWYFDPQQGVLVYIVSNVDYFETTLNGRPRIRLKVDLIYKADDSRRGNDYIQGVTIHSLDDYAWK